MVIHFIVHLGSILWWKITKLLSIQVDVKLGFEGFLFLVPLGANPLNAYPKLAQKFKYIGIPLVCHSGEHFVMENSSVIVN